MGLISKTAFLYWVVCLVSAPVVYAAQQDPQVAKLPDPLTLEYALSLADEAHPDLIIKDADILSAEAKKQKLKANNGLEVDIDLSLFATNDDTSQNVWRQDHARAGVIVSSTFFDFGYTDSLVSGADELKLSSQLAYHDARGKRRLEIMAAYFDVLLADLKFSLYNEAMAVGYVNFDKAKDRREMGQRTDLNVMRRESEYQRLRVRRYESENEQRQTREKLAEVLNRPGQPPGNLAMPQLDVLKRKLTDVEDLHQQAFEKNFHLQALRHEVRAAENDLQAARSSDGPELKGTVAAYGFETDSGSSDELRAELSLIYNLYEPQRDASVAAELARLYKARAQLDKAESWLRLEILKIWHQLEELTVKREEAEVRLVLKELELERSRALYEMEVKADLGYSMSELTSAQLNSAMTDYQLALAWYKMDLLTASIKMDLDQRLNRPDEHDQEKQ